jgi:hypothetical protein
VAPAGGVQLICVNWPAVTLVGFAVTTIAGHTVTFVETDMVVMGLTLILVLGVPLTLTPLVQEKPVAPLVKVHPLRTWPLLSVT